MQRLLIARAFWLAVGLALAPGTGDAETEATREPTVAQGSGVIAEFLSCELGDGSFAFAAPSLGDMPWRVSIGKPHRSPNYGSRKDARNAAVESMELWARLIRTRLAWFRLEFAEKDPEAPIQIKWKRRTSGSIQGQAGPTCMTRDGQVMPGGRMEIAIRSCPTCSSLSVDDIRVLVTHEFGHILGLGHCLSCDSAMNYSWQTEGRSLVTGVDIDAVVRRFDMAEERAPKAIASPFDRDDLVELAAANEPIDFVRVSCDKPFVLSRSCSDSKGPRKRKKIESLDMRLAATKDGLVLLVTPKDTRKLASMQVATQAANESFYIVTHVALEAGVSAIRATALVAQRQVLGYLIEFDGNAWKALGL